LLIYAAIRVWLGFQTGELPGLDAMAPLIPALVLDSARAGGVITDRDTVLYVFAPHGHGVKDALLVTTRDIIAVTGGRPRRFPTAEDNNIDLNQVRGRVYVIIRPASAGRADTIYNSMSGLELKILGLALSRTLRDPPAH
jgi:hypothetical protein